MMTWYIENGYNYKNVEMDIIRGAYQNGYNDIDIENGYNGMKTENGYNDVDKENVYNDVNMENGHREWI